MLFRTDRQNVLSESYEKVKFALQDEKTAERILVTEPRLANYLQEALHTTHDHFEPCTRSLSGNVRLAIALKSNYISIGGAQPS